MYIDWRTNIPLIIYSVKKAALEKSAAEAKLAEELAGMHCVSCFSRIQIVYRSTYKYSAYYLFSQESRPRKSSCRSQTRSRGRRYEF